MHALPLPWALGSYQPKPRHPSDLPTARPFEPRFSSGLRHSVPTGPQLNKARTRFILGPSQGHSH